MKNAIKIFSFLMVLSVILSSANLYACGGGKSHGADKAGENAAENEDF